MRTETSPGKTCAYKHIETKKMLDIESGLITPLSILKKNPKKLILERKFYIFSKNSKLT
jgi:hypothetical protein